MGAMRLPIRQSFLVFALLWAMGPVSGCASIPDDETDGSGGSGTVVTVACLNDLTGDLSLLDWELTVTTTDPIEGGEPFNADLSGVAVFSETFLDTAQTTIPGGVDEANLVELNATVHVREGALGTDVILTTEPIPYRCFTGGRGACDPANDVLDDPPKPPGLRGNTDCQPEGPANPCGRFILLPTTTDCDPGGVCARKGKTGPQSQCDLNGFCVTDDLRVDLQQVTERYTANVRGNVLFGWDDESTGATVQEGGADDGTWILPPAHYDMPAGPIGFRVTVGGFPVALECTMGVDSKGPHGVGSLNFLSSPTPDEVLISIPIEPLL